MPPVLAEAGAGAAVARPAQAAQVVVPSGICTPHELQNAIAVFLLCRHGKQATDQARA